MEAQIGNKMVIYYAKGGLHIKEVDEMGNPKFAVSPDGREWRLVERKKPGPKPKGGDKTIKDLYPIALSKVRKTKSEGYKKGFQGHWKNLKPYFGDLPCNSLDQEYVQGYVLEREKPGRTIQTIRLELRALKRIVRVETATWELPKWIGKNPGKSTELSLRMDDVLEVFEVVQNQSKQYGSTYSIIGLIAIMTSMRLKDICDLTENKIDRKNWTITFRQSKVQNMLWSRGDNTIISETVIPISSGLRKVFTSIPRGFDKDKRLFDIPSSKAVTTAFCRAFKKLNINASFMSFRHIAASTMLEVGANVNTVRGLLGHKKLSTTMKYLHALESDKQRATESLSIKMEGNSGS